MVVVLVKNTTKTQSFGVKPLYTKKLIKILNILALIAILYNNPNILYKFLPQLNICNTIFFINQQS